MFTDPSRKMVPKKCETRTKAASVVSQLILWVAGARKPIFLVADMVSAVMEDRDAQEVCCAAGGAGTRGVAESGLEGQSGSPKTDSRQHLAAIGCVGGRAHELSQYRVSVRSAKSWANCAHEPENTIAATAKSRRSTAPSWSASKQSHPTRIALPGPVRHWVNER